jgi:hypothetical protein
VVGVDTSLHDGDPSAFPDAVAPPQVDAEENRTAPLRITTVVGPSSFDEFTIIPRFFLRNPNAHRMHSSIEIDSITELGRAT